MQFHYVFVVYFSHHLDLIYQRFFSFLFTVCSLFRKGFDCISFAVFMLMDEVDSGEIPFPYLFDGLE